MAGDEERPVDGPQANDIPTVVLNKAGRRSGGLNPFLSHDEDGNCRAVGRKPATTTGKGKGALVDQTNWRVKLQHSRIKFDDEQKLVYLRTLAADGLKGRAAEAAGVALTTVQKHLDNDPDFSEMFEEAVQAYNDMIKAAVKLRGVDGWLEPVFAQGVRAKEFLLDAHGHIVLDDEGEPLLVPASVRKFSDSLLALEAKRTDPAYRDKGDVSFGPVVGGVLLVSPTDSEEEAKAEYEKSNATKISPVERRQIESADTVTRE